MIRTPSGLCPPNAAVERKPDAKRGSEKLTAAEANGRARGRKPRPRP